MKQSETKKVAKVAIQYSCICCDYNTSRKSSYTKHLATDKHQILQLETNLKQNETKVAKVAKSSHDTTIACDKCGSTFKSRASQWRHKKKCKGSNDVMLSKVLEQNSMLIYQNAELAKQNTELATQTNVVMKEISHQNTDMMKEIAHLNTDMMKEITNQNTHVVEKICELSKEKSMTMTNCNNNNTNNQFNLNVFLNETCKDAMNMSEFIETLNPQLSDLEALIYLGFAKGTSKIFLDGLKEMDNNQKPIHCSDLKREVFYIKESNQWQKDSDNNNTLLVRAIRQIVNKNIKSIIEWQKVHPEYNDPDSKQNDVYNKIIMEAMSGSTEEETNKNMAKIFKILAKETTIDKKIE